MPAKQKTPFEIDPETLLATIGLPYIDVVLTERFLLPPEALIKIGDKVPTTLKELAVMSGMPIHEAWSILRECLEIDRDIYAPVEDLSLLTKKDGTMLLDMRPGVDFETEPLHPDARLFHLQNPKNFLPFLRTLGEVYVISYNHAHAWSAAASLRKMGIVAFVTFAKPVP